MNSPPFVPDFYREQVVGLVSILYMASDKMREENRS